MDTIEARIAEVRSKQMLWEHGACVAYLSTTRERPNWVEWQFFQGSHDECEALVCAFAHGPGIEEAMANCHFTTVN